MTPTECAEFLRQHNAWRRGGDGPQTDPVKLGIALDAAVAHLEAMKSNKTNDGCSAAISTSELGRCWPWSHKYGKWESTHAVTKSRVKDDAVLERGTMQERKCNACGKLQLRTVWARDVL